MLICLALIRLIFTRSKTLGHLKDKKEIESIFLLVYYTVLNNNIYKHIRDRRYCRFGLRWTIATSAIGQTRSSRLTYRWTTGHVGGAVGRRLGSSGWYIKYVGNGILWWEVSGTAFVDGLVPRARSSFPLMGVVTALITAPINYSLIRTFHLS